jgi:predicted DNA-binding ribbon-helix-helix protein
MRRNAVQSPSVGSPPDGRMRTASTLVNRNVTVAGRRTSIRLEPVMWDALQHVCRREGTGLNALVTEIDRQRVESSLTASIRVYLLRYFRAAATDEGHRLAGHGAAPAHQLPV